MQVMKFGGTSMGDAARMRIVAEIVKRRAASTRVAVVVSAVGGVTNQLMALVSVALQGDDTSIELQKIRAQHDRVINELADVLGRAQTQKLLSFVLQQFHALGGDLHGVRLLHECPDSAQVRILAHGEQLSSRIMQALLHAHGLDVALLDPVSLIRTEGPLLEGQAQFDVIDSACAGLRIKSAPVLLMPGFIAGTSSGQMSLLGRNGSDLSGALLAMGLHADLCEIWTDVDGVYSADPRSVPDARFIAEMSYAEAMELSYFGAKVLHPKTIAPIARYAIPTRIRNTFNLTNEGTLIHSNADHSRDPVRGISCLDNVALINLSGPGMKGVAGMAARLFGALAKRHISLTMITQSSSEYSISFGVVEKDADAAMQSINDEFQLELQARWLDAPECLRAQTVLSIVGDGMRQRRGIAGQFFSALASADVNIEAIAQGSSERSISAVIAREDSLRALRATHQQFFNTAQVIELFVVGAGSVGAKLLEQIAEQQQQLLAQGIDLRVQGVANSRQMLLSSAPLSLAIWREQLASSQTFDFEKLLTHVQEQRYLNPVLVDASASDVIAKRYLDALRVGMHVVTPNKRANTMDQDYYRQLRQQANAKHRLFLYETNVGAGLPVIDTLQNLLKSGDELKQFSGVLSGSMSYVFGLLEDGLLFSEAVKQARAKQFTEPDPRDDLSGMDVARKALILFREAGGTAELADVLIDSVFPSGFDYTGEVDDFMARLPQVDAYFHDWVARLRGQNKVLRFCAQISDGLCRVGLIEVANTHPLYAIRGGENALAFHTRRYHPVPLVIRGYGAGAEVTAGGVFADILRTVRFNPVRN